MRTWATPKCSSPSFEQIDGFVDNIRYRSLTRDGWILSLSGWRDEKALVRWRTRAKHHDVQEKGRNGIMLDYHLRVGQNDARHACASRPPASRTAAGRNRSRQWHHGDPDRCQLVARTVKAATDPKQLAEDLGFKPDTARPVSWDVFDAVLTPGEVILLVTWRDQTFAEAFEGGFALQPGMRLRRVRVIRDYGMFDRREAPQYYPDAIRAQSVS